MSEFYGNDHEEKPLATLTYNWKRVAFSPWNLILIPCTAGLYLLWILRNHMKFGGQTYRIYPGWVECIDKFSSISGKTRSFQFDNIEKIEVSKDIFDPMFGTGRIKVRLKGSKFWNNFSMNCIGDVDKAARVFNNALNKYKMSVRIQ